MASTELLVLSTPMIEVEEDPHIPTVLSYVGGKVLIGHEALSLASKHRLVLNEDFKIDLGNSDPGSIRRKRFHTAAGDQKSAAELTADFMEAAITKVRDWLAHNGLEAAPSLLIAEPLKDPNNPTWIQNYRANLSRILQGKGFKKEQIDFLPEPFAVFQYYRWGFRHPALADRRVHRALVLDFGGGTFDACVVETTKEGDIRQGGKNAYPLGASSVPVGGFEINRHIAEYLALKTHRTIDAKVKKGLDSYRKWRRDSDDLSTTSAEYRQFVTNFHQLVHDVEKSKIALSSNTSNWSLVSPPNLTFPFRVKRNLFDDTSEDTTIHLSTGELLTIFVKQVWPRVKATIANTIASARAQMSNAPLSVVLMSGGSSGFGWLRELLKRDFADELGDARVLNLPEYREVVAKGLAIECARRFYVDQGDFGAVTYNRLCLTLAADGRAETAPKYSPRFGSDRPALPDGVLLPSSTSLAKLIDQPLKWRFRLDHPPRQKLQYFFMRSSFDPQDLENLQNVADHTVYTPNKTTFDSQLHVELTVAHDGTACPRFIYKTGKSGEESQVAGRPFYMDMTSVGEAAPAVAYLGLDFGTSNSALAYLSRDTMDRVETRGTDSSWLSLHELIHSLPYPLAKPLRRVIAGTESVNSQEGAKKVLEFIEACLSLLSYAAFVEWCATGGSASHYFKGFTQRSSGPLWALLKQCLKSLGKNAKMLAPAQRLLQSEVAAQVDQALKVLVDVKHDKGNAGEADLMRAMMLMGNDCHDVFRKCAFGYFEGVQKKRFATSFSGRFRIAHGAAQPFSTWLHIESAESFADLQTCLVHLETLDVISLEPLYLWDFAEYRALEDEAVLYVFDRQEKEQSSFKATSTSQSILVGPYSKYCEVAEVLVDWKEKDPLMGRSKLLSIREEGSSEDMEAVVIQEV